MSTKHAPGTENTRMSSKPESVGQQTRDPYKMRVLGLAVLVAVTPVVLFAIGWLASPHRFVSPGVPISYTAAGGSSAAQSGPLSAEQIYTNTCALCHGADGQGVARLGKPLRNSAYVQSLDDQALFDQIANGRMPDDPLNTTGSLMPARGAQNLGDAEIHLLVTLLRGMQDPTQPTASVEQWDLKSGELATAGSSESGEAHPGEAIFVTSCSACHGAKGEGIEGLGKPFTTSEFVAQSSDKELMTMIKMGRPIWDAANSTGIDMPPKGGNPALSDEELQQIIDYIRSVSTGADQSAIEG